MSRKRRSMKTRNRDIKLAGGETITPPHNALQRVTTAKPEKDPRQTVIAARKRHAGAQCKDTAIDPLLSTPMGCCIAHTTRGDDRAKLIDTWGALSASRRNYMLRYIGQSGEPKGAAIAMVPDAMETDPSMRIDIRSADEKAQQAVNSWRSWEASIKALPLPQMRWAIRGALDGFHSDATLWRDQGATAMGRVAVHALRLLGEV